MYSGLISKIDKARKYSGQPYRVKFLEFAASFQGDNGDHTITFHQGAWNCACPFFVKHDTCSHTMAMGQLLEQMLPEVGSPTSDAL